MKKTWIIKRSGSSEIYSEDKLKRSLKRAGAKEDIITNVVKEISLNVHEGMNTREVYSQAFELMRQNSPPHAARYKLKSAINELGPSGFPFEFFIAELFKSEGYTPRLVSLCKVAVLNIRLSCMGIRYIFMFINYKYA